METLKLKEMELMSFLPLLPLMLPIDYDCITAIEPRYFSNFV